MKSPDTTITPTIDKDQSPTVQASSRPAATLLKARRMAIGKNDAGESKAKGMSLADIKVEGNKALAALAAAGTIAVGMAGAAVVATRHAEGAAATGGSDEPEKGQVAAPTGKYAEQAGNVEANKAHNAAVERVSADRDAEKDGAVIETIGGDDGRYISEGTAAIARGEAPAQEVPPATADTGATPVQVSPEPTPESPFQSGKPNQIAPVESGSLPLPPEAPSHDLPTFPVGG